MENQKKNNFKDLDWTSMNLTWSSILKSVWDKFCLICLSFRTLTREIHWQENRMGNKTENLIPIRRHEDFHSTYSSIDSWILGTHFQVYKNMSVMLFVTHSDFNPHSDLQKTERKNLREERMITDWILKCFLNRLSPSQTAPASTNRDPCGPLLSALYVSHSSSLSLSATSFQCNPQLLSCLMLLYSWKWLFVTKACWEARHSNYFNVVLSLCYSHKWISSTAMKQRWCNLSKKNSA